MADFPPSSSEIWRPVDDIELILIWILRLWSRISEDLGAIKVTELIDMQGDMTGKCFFYPPKKRGIQSHSRKQWPNIKMFLAS